MADNRKQRDDTEEEAQEQEQPISPAVLLPKVQKLATLNRWLLIVAVSVSVLIMSTMGAALFVMHSQIQDLQTANETDEQSEIDQRFVALEERLALLAEFRRSELKKIKKYTEQLSRLTDQCSAERVIPFIDYLAERELDFQKTITLISDGTTSLARMNIGSKSWLEPYSAQLAELQKNSDERVKNLSTLK